MPLPAVQDRGGRPMSTATSIEWTEVTWNPTTGCDRISPGCDHCYALTLAKRLKAMGQAKYQTDGDPRTSGPGFGVALHEEVLTEPLRWRKPRVCFVDSMADLAHAKVPAAFVARVFATMAATPQHTYQVLTKRPGRLASLLGNEAFHGEVAHHLLAMSHDPDGRPDPAFLKRASNPWEAWPLPNVWVGTSIELDRYAWRADLLRQAMARIRFLSLEPLLGPLPSLDLAGIDWVIVGGRAARGIGRWTWTGSATCATAAWSWGSPSSSSFSAPGSWASVSQPARSKSTVRISSTAPRSSCGVPPSCVNRGTSPSRSARATMCFSFKAHTPRAASRPCAASTTARASPPPQCCGKPRPWQLADQHPGDRQLADDHVGGDAGQVERQPIDPEPALLGLGQVVLNLVEVPVVQVDPAALDGQPGAAVHPTAPLPGREHRSRPAERADVVRVEPAAVEQPEVPVAVGPVLALSAGAAQGDREHAGDRCRLVGDQLGELLVVDDHTASTAAVTSLRTHSAVACQRGGSAETTSSVARVASGRLLFFVVAGAAPARRPPLRLLGREVG